MRCLWLSIRIITPGDLGPCLFDHLVVHAAVAHAPRTDELAPRIERCCRIITVSLSGDFLPEPRLAYRAIPIPWYVKEKDFFIIWRIVSSTARRQLTFHN